MDIFKIIMQVRQDRTQKSLRDLHRSNGLL